MMRKKKKKLYKIIFAVRVYSVFGKFVLFETDWGRGCFPCVPNRKVNKEQLRRFPEMYSEMSSAGWLAHCMKYLQLRV